MRYTIDYNLKLLEDVQPLDISSTKILQKDTSRNTTHRGMASFSNRFAIAHLQNKDSTAPQKFLTYLNL